MRASRFDCFRRSTLGVVVAGVVAFSAVTAQAADIDIRPVNASGVEGTDWMAGPGPNDITLFSGGQDVTVEFFLTNLGTDNVAAYQMGMDCIYGFTIAGEIDPYNTECLLAGLPFDGGNCLGVDESRADYVLADGIITIPACQTVDTCAGPGTPGRYICGAVLVAGAPGSGPGDHYATTYGWAVSANAKGTAQVGVDLNPTVTLISDNLGKVVAVGAVLNANIIIPTSGCCGVAGAPLQCLDDATAGECAAAGGSPIAGACSGVEGPIAGLDSACPTCDDAIPDEIECNDNNACTVDFCGGAGCENNDNTPAGQCCAPTDGALLTIDDGDPCTDDVCNADGSISHPPAAAGTPCDDTLQCTSDDVCDGAFGCLGTDINTIACPSGDPLVDCPTAGQSCAGGFCVCSTTTQLTLGSNAACSPAGGAVPITVDIGDGSANVCGAQFLVNYDPNCLDYVDFTASDTWNLVVFTDVDEVNGVIFMAVGVTPGQPCAIAGTLATLNFTKVDSCPNCSLCFDSVNPQNTILTDDAGESVDIETNCSDAIGLAGGVSIATPDSVVVNPNCDTASATVTWGPITSDGSCGGATHACTAFHSAGVNVDELIALGGLFPQGLSTFTCIATDTKCGDTVTQSWTVDVTDQHSLDVEVQLSPVIAGDPLVRSICFDFYSDCVQAPSATCRDLTFGFPFDFIGKSTTTLSVAKGQFACITAEDPFHTLRSMSDINCVGDTLVAEFKGDPMFSGNWLVSGNLDNWLASGNGDTIDILDFGMFFSQYQMVMDPNTPAGTAGPHSDINGDGVVDGSDFTFISANFLDNSKNSCCADGPANATPENPIVSITVKELRRRGLGSLVVADLNGDQIVDQADMVAFLQGNVPARDVKRGAGSNAGRSSLGQ